MKISKLEKKYYNNTRVWFDKELAEKIDKELEKVRKQQEENENRTYTQEELDAIILGENYSRTI